MLSSVVTGASDGIGFFTALDLSKRGFSVGVHARNQAKAELACAALLDKAHGRGNFIPLFGDLCSMAEVRGLAQQVLGHFSSLDVLVNNAGVYMDQRVLTADGFETTMAVNHFSHFLLTALLRPALLRAPAARVVNVSSKAHHNRALDLADLTFANSFDGYTAYARSKLANVLFTHALARRLRDTGITTHALHPGTISTKLLHKGFTHAGAPTATGAATSVYVATAPELEGKTGLYFADGREEPCAPHANDEALEDALWEESERLTAGTAVECQPAW